MGSSVFEKLEAIGRQRSRDLKADSCTYYVPDPVWPGEHRLVLMLGVRIREPMHGFMMTPSSRRVLLEGDSELWVRDMTKDDVFRETQETPLSRIAKQQPLFLDFARREGLIARARIHWPPRGPRRSILFVNFKSMKRFTESQRAAILQLAAELGEYRGQIEDELRAKSAVAFPPLLRILQAPLPLRGASVDFQKEFMRGLLEASFDAVGLDRNADLGTIHLFDPSTDTLTMNVSYGAYEPDLEPQTVSDGDGILSWVALKRGALLINDLERSSFRSIYVEHLRGAKSEIAVPILAHEELIGVLNLESTTAGRFDEEKVRVLSYAASRAAVAFVLEERARANAELAEETEGLLDICHEATAESDDRLEKGLNRLAQVMQHRLGAKRCDIWQWQNDRQQFVPVGCSDWSDLDRAKPPRKTRGWSRWIVDKATAVWIYDIKRVGGFKWRSWNSTTSKWRFGAKTGRPRAVHKTLTEGVCCCLGLPIKVAEDIEGVVWAKFEQPQEVPSARRLEAVTKYAEFSGLLMSFPEAFLRHDQRVEQAIRQRVEEFRDQLFRTEFDLPPKLEVGIANERPTGEIGGDIFFIFPEMGGSRVHFLLADGVAKGMFGALNMLPILTTYRAFCEKTNSTKYLLERLLETSASFEMTLGTALCGLIDFTPTLEKRPRGRPKGQPVLCASSAGHPGFMVLRPGETEQVPRPDDPGLVPGLWKSLNWGDRLIIEAWKQLKSGDRVIGYTDGIHEAEGGKKGLFGTDGIEATCKHANSRDLNASQLARRILDDAKAHSGGKLTDDATVLVLRIR